MDDDPQADILPPLTRRPADLGAAGGEHRRRRRPERRRAVRRSTAPIWRSSRAIGRQLVERVKAAARRRRRRHLAERRQAGAVGPGRSAEGGGPRRADRRRGRSAAAARRRRPGDHLQRGRRAVRSAPARPGREPLDRAGDRGADGAVVTAGQRAARQRRDVHARHGAVGHQPPGAPAAGDGLLPTSCPTASQAAVQDAMQAEFETLEPGHRLPRRASPAGRASSDARRRTSCSPSCCRSCSCI